MNKIRYARLQSGLIVEVDGQEPPLKKSLKLFNHSPSGFNIGYAGSGPAQLALAILLLFTDDRTAVRLHQPFKEAFLMNHADLEALIGEIEVDIPQWITEHRKS